jgi:soluble lytic murein transglycosylase-like protein
MTPQEELVVEARAAAVRHRLDPALVCAVIEQESSWNSYAIRYEPTFRERYVAVLELAPTEEIARSTSWGLMQVMGQVAREHGFARQFLSGLCLPEIGVEIGCAVLANKLSAAEGDLNAGLLLWNGGGDRSYPSRVLSKLSSYSLV